MVRELIGYNSEPVNGTYFTRRLEAFNDVVFGFTLSILASNLQRVDFAHPDAAILAIGLYFTTFALTVGIWYTQYMTFHFAFVGARIDVILNFVLLSFAVLVPFTLQRVMERDLSLDEFYQRFIPYAIAFAAVFALSGILKLRGLKRFGDLLEPAVQKRVFRSAVVGLSTPFVFALGLGLTHIFGGRGMLALWLIAAVAIVARRLRAVPQVFLPDRPSAPV